MNEKREKELGFAAQLPKVGHVLNRDCHPRMDELETYDEMFFDPVYDGFDKDLEHIGDLPYRTSREVKDSPLGVGFELLDHRNGYDFKKVLPIARKSGVKWARLQSGWQRAEKEPGKYDFAWLDEIVDGLLDAGIRPWFSLGFGNPLYMDGAEAIPPKGNYFYSPVRFGEKGIRGWANYCKAMAEHFKTRVFYWEVWNEPNAGFMRKPFQGNKMILEPPELYAELVAITEKAIHEVQKEARIIGGAISGGNLQISCYIHGLFRCGIADHIDIFSYHPYTTVPELYFPENFQFIQSLIEKSGRPIQIWQGENGRPSNSMRLRRGWKSTEGSQARYLTRRYLTDLRLGADMTSYFLICDIGNSYAGKRQVHAQGVIDATDPDNYRPKLSFRAMQSMAYLFDSETKRMRDSFELVPMQGWGRTTLPIEYASGITCGFRWKDFPLFAYYHPTHIDADWQVKPVQTWNWVPDGMRLDRPVLIDPITARVYRIVTKNIYNGPTWGMPEKGDGTVSEFPRLPLLDYPLFVTDAALLDEKGKE